MIYFILVATLILGLMIMAGIIVRMALLMGRYPITKRGVMMIRMQSRYQLLSGFGLIAFGVLNMGGLLTAFLIFNGAVIMTLTLAGNRFWRKYLKDIERTAPDFTSGIKEIYKGNRKLMFSDMKEAIFHYLVGLQDLEEKTASVWGLLGEALLEEGMDRESKICFKNEKTLSKFSAGFWDLFEEAIVDKMLA